MIELDECERPRFWRLVQVGSDVECWPWLGAVGEKGHGRFKLRGKLVTASRVAFAISVAQPGELCVLHRCDNPPCCNPEHLFLGTVADNNADGRAKGRIPPPPVQSGVTHHSAKLTPELVMSIRSGALSSASARAIGRMLGVSSRAVNKVRSGVTWQEPTP